VVRVSTMEQIEITPVSVDLADRFHRAIDAAAREQKYLPILEVLPVQAMRAFAVNPIKPDALTFAKSTVMNLILCLYEVGRGRSCATARTSRLSPSRAADRLCVPRELPVQKGPMRDNIAMGRPSASEEEIVAAAKAAYARDFIMGFERGYDSPCSEHGMQLSGGQRQTYPIARAFLKDAPIILLDEATWALDSESEQAIQKALRTLCEGRSTIVIAHRLRKPTKSGSWTAPASSSAATTPNC
jgi:ABC-type thiamine transport system ATPase subunit